MDENASPYSNRGGVKAVRQASGDSLESIKRNLLDVEYAIQNQPQTVALAKLQEALQRIENLRGELRRIGG